MKSTQYQKLNRDVLIEWTYDDNNIIQEPYKIVNNQRDLIKSYVASDSTTTKNNFANQLFRADFITNRYTKMNTDEYPFLTSEEYVDPEPVIHDKIRIYFPSNWIFGEYQGLYLRLYTYDSTNKKYCDLSNFFFDVTDSNTATYLKSDIIPALEYQERLWNKFIELDVPSLYHVSRVAVDPVYFLDTSVNFKLSNGIGLSQDAPIFVDFRLITRISTLVNTKFYNLTNPFLAQFPQRPQMEGIKLTIIESKRGDYFEIYGTYNGTFADFVDYMNTSKSLGKVYSLEFTITVFEDNRAGKTVTYTSDENFGEVIDFRPILRYSSSTANIDVEMRIVDKDSGQITSKKAIYGMKPDQLSKYGVNFKKIDVRNTFKPKIYQKIRSIDYQYDKVGKNQNPENKLQVPVPELKIINQTPEEVVAFSKSALNFRSSIRTENYHSIGKMKIGIKPFDNLINFTLYIKDGETIKPFDLTDSQNIKLIFKGESDTLEVSQFITQDNTAPTLGMFGFKVREQDYNRLRDLFQKGGRLFYITCTNQGYRCMIYSGLFTVEEPVVIIPDGISEPARYLTPAVTQTLGTALVSRKVADRSTVIQNNITRSTIDSNLSTDRSVRE